MPTEPLTITVNLDGLTTGLETAFATLGMSMGEATAAFDRLGLALSGVALSAGENAARTVYGQRCRVAATELSSPRLTALAGANPVRRAIAVAGPLDFGRSR